jgi:hypothetical protein
MIKNMMIDMMCRDIHSGDCGIDIYVSLRTARKLRRLGTSIEEYKDALAQEGMKRVTNKVIDDFTSSSPYGAFLNTLWAR